jgi:hypothetical protein
MVSLETRLWVGQVEFDSCRASDGILSLHHHIQTSSEAHPASFPMCTGSKVAGA